MKKKKDGSPQWSINYPVIVGIAVGVIILVLFGPFLFGSSLFLFTDIGSDTVNIFWPTYIEGARHWMEYGMPGYSFEQGMGMDTFSDHMFRPFQILIEWAGRDNIPFVIAYIEVLKLALIAYILHCYTKLNNYDAKLSVLFVLLGTFTGFVVLGSSWYVFSTRALQFYLLIYGLDYLIKRKKINLFVLAIFLIASYQPFYLYLFGVFGAVYLFVKYPELIRKFSSNTASFLRLVVGSILGLIVSAPFLWSKLKQVTEGPRLAEASLGDKLLANSNGIDLGGHFSSLLLRLFGNNTLGVGDEYTGWNNYLEGPLVYMGSLALVLALYYTIACYKDNKRPTVIALVSILILTLPILRNSIWLFQGDYQRELGLVIGFVILLGFVEGWKLILKNGFQAKYLLFILAFLLLLLMVGSRATLGRVANEYLALYIFFLVGQLGLLFLLSKKGSKFVYLTLVGAVGLELMVLHYPTFHQREVIEKKDVSKRIYYNDLTLEAVASLPEMKDDFYRVHKLYPSGPSKYISLNDSKVFDYYSTVAYHSFNANSYIKFYELFDIVDYSKEHTTRWTTGFIEQPLLMNFVANRFVMVQKGQPLPPFLDATYSLYKDFGSIEVYQNPNPLSLAQVFTSRLDESSIRKLDLNKRIRALYNGVILDSTANANSQLPYFDLNSLPTDYTIRDYNSEVAALQENSKLEITSFEPEHISGKLTVNHSGALLFSIPFDPYWKLKLNGESINLETLNMGLMGLSNIDSGEYSLELSYKAKYISTGKYFFFGGLLIFVFVVFMEEKSKLFKNK